jgi:hypothetical protein
MVLEAHSLEKLQLDRFGKELMFLRRASDLEI